MKKVLAFICATLLASCMINVNASRPSLNNPHGVHTLDVSKVEKSIAMVYANAVDQSGRMSGTAFAIDDDYLITAGHVCAGLMEFQDQGILEDNIRLQLSIDGKPSVIKSNVEVVDIDGVHDICLMRKQNHGLRALEFVEKYSRDVEFESSLWIVGYPYGVNFSWQEGNVINPNFKGELLVSAAAAAGNSGSPVVNADGKVIGILVRGYQPYDHLSICVQASTVKKFIKIVGWKMEE